MQAETLVREGKLDECVAALATQIRAKPQDAKLRIFMFQLSAVMGQWDRAMDQLDIAAQMDPSAQLMAQVCKPAIHCERYRQEVFAGRRTPLVLGEPTEWVAQVIQAAMMSGQGNEDAAAELRTKAFDAAPAISGKIELVGTKGDDSGPAKKGEAISFEWIADYDARLGPMLEAIIEGKYYWIPYSHILMIEVDAPVDLRDIVWTPAKLVLGSGGQQVALIPTRYPGSELASQPPAVRMARTTILGGPDGDTPMGQRVLATDQGEYALMQIERIVLGDPAKLQAALMDVHAKRAEEMQAKLIASGAMKTGLPGGVPADSGAGAGGNGGGSHG